MISRNTVSAAVLIVPLATVHALGEPIPQTGGRAPIKLTGIGPAKMLVREVQQPGETRADKAVPSHPNALRLSRDVWLVLFGTRMFTGTDDDRSIYCQLRRGQVDGPLIRERLLASETAWDPEKYGESVRKVHGTPTGFGVPKGAMIQGRPASNANLFMVTWYTYPKIRVEGKNADLTAPNDSAMATAKAPADLDNDIRIESVQFRLKEAEDDIEIVQPAGLMRQRGFENRKVPGPIAGSMNHSMMPPKPADAAYTRWMEIDHFGKRLAAVVFEFNRDMGIYEWVETGPLSPELKGGTTEATLVRHGDEWIVCARSNGSGHGKTAWFRLKDPLKEWSAPVLRDEPQSWCPRSIGVCADGVLRIFSNDRDGSPGKEPRNPLYCWDVNPDDFTVSNRRVVFDSRAAGLPLSFPFIDAPKLLPAGVGRQFVGFRVLTPLKWHKIPNYPVVLTPAEFDVLGCYVAELKYDGPIRDEWSFEAGEASLGPATKKQDRTATTITTAESGSTGGGRLLACPRSRGEKPASGTARF